MISGIKEEVNSSILEDFSCIKKVEKVVHLALPITFISNENTGVIEILDSWKRQYNQQLEGILVNYSNVGLVSRENKIIIDKLCIQVDVKAKFDLFCPAVGNIVKGKINRISKEHVGCLVHDTINVVIKLNDYCPDELYKFIHLEQEILFEITHFETQRKEIRVKGKITPDCLKLMDDLIPIVKSDEISNFSFLNQNTITQYDFNDDSNPGVNSARDVSSSNQNEPVDIKPLINNLALHENSPFVEKTERQISDSISLETNHVIKKATKRKRESSLSEENELEKTSKKPKKEVTQIEENCVTKKSKKPKKDTNPSDKNHLKKKKKKKEKSNKKETGKKETLNSKKSKLVASGAVLKTDEKKHPKRKHLKKDKNKHKDKKHKRKKNKDKHEENLTDS